MSQLNCVKFLHFSIQMYDSFVNVLEVDSQSKYETNSTEAYRLNF
jgi:hypothetical protein